MSKTELVETHVHQLADVEDPEWSLGDGCTIWRYSHVRKGARLGKYVMVGNNCFVDMGVVVGDGTRIQNGVSIYKGTTIGKEVFIAPSVTLSNCRFPMIRNEDTPEFVPDEIVVEDYAIVGIGATVIAPAIIGEGAFVGGGSVVTTDVFPYTVVFGNPAKLVRGICRCCKGELPLDWVLGQVYYDVNNNGYICPNCSAEYRKVMRGDGKWKGKIVIEYCGRKKNEVDY